jgi:hypothetical protein
MFILQTPPVQPSTSPYWNATQWGNLAQWASAILTFFAICFALFKEEVLRLIRHPELSVRLEARFPDCVKSEVNHKGEIFSRYFVLLWIKNEGNVRAENVEVFLSRAWTNKGNGFEEVAQFRPMNLRWSFLDWKNPVIHAVGISPDMGRHCDLGAITDPNHPDLKSLPEESEKTRLCLQTEFLGPTTGWWLPGKYRFRLLVAASNRKPAAYFVEIHLTGLWFEDQAEMFKNGFTVNVRRA